MHAIMVCTYRSLCTIFTVDSVCVSTLSGGGYICEETPSYSTSLVISGFEGDQGFLDELIQDYIESLLVLNSYSALHSM